jgi:hemerythrin
MRELLAWNETYSVGNAMLDADHKIIFSLLAQLHEAADTDQSRDVLASVLNVLTEYAEHHFRREEMMMARAGYPDQAAHREKHLALESKVKAVQSRWAEGDRQVLNLEVLELLKKWLTGHILEDDKAYGPWMETMPVDGTPSEDPA